MQRSDVVAAVAKSWSELAPRYGYAAAMDRTFAKSGITNKLDGSTDNELSTDVKRLLDDVRGSEWQSRKCSFFEWRRPYLNSLPPPEKRERSIAYLME